MRSLGSTALIVVQKRRDSSWQCPSARRTIVAWAIAPVYSGGRFYNGHVVAPAMDIDELLEGEELTWRQAIIIFFSFLILILLAALVLVVFSDVFRGFVAIG